MGKVVSRRALGVIALACSLGAACGQRAGSGYGSSYVWGSPPAGSAGAADAGQAGAGKKGSGDSGAAVSNAIDGGSVTVAAAMWDAKTATDAVRKVKNLLIGLPPTDADAMAVMNRGPAALQELILQWMTSSTLPLFQAKMIFFFRNAFQQTGFTPTVDFQNQLLQNGGFDFGPFGSAAVGDDSYARLVQNLQDEFAMTAWQLVQEGHSFLETLTTQRYMMTTGLKMVYLQIEMPNDQPFSFGNFGQQTNKLAWSIDYSGNPIPLANAIQNMTFSDEPPANPGNSFLFGNNSMFPTCRGSTTTPTGSFTGYAQLFQRIIGYTPRYPFAMQPTCWEHPSKPYLTTQDVSDWEWVTIQPKGSGDAYVQPYDLPTLRNATTLSLALPRVGFYTTPAFLALWNTNDSNQHRVTANQALLAALGESFTSDATIIPISESGLDSAHTTTTSDCYGCHKSLDPMRNFWANQLDFNDRNDWLTNTFMGAVPNPKPTATGGVFAFGDVNASGGSIADFGTLLGQVTDGAAAPLNQFAVGMTQKLCYYANSTACDTTDPEFRRVVGAFVNGFNFPTLIKELFASPLVTGAVDTKTFAKGTVPISISRRDHFCQGLSNRLAVPDLCALAATLPSQAQSATASVAGAVVADTFSRGSPTPVTPQDPNLFFRAAVESLCQTIAPQVVDSGPNSLFSSTNVSAAIDDMVQRVMGYPPSDSHHDMAVSILQNHMQSAQAQSTASVALQSTFVLACESPTSVSVGL
jgi:hypothetical protein